MIGDFNARTKALNEFITEDLYNLDLYDNDEHVQQRAEDENMLCDFGIPQERYSCDNRTNNYGHKLIDLCKNFGVVIVNGRVGKDAYLGKVTCKDASVVDYCIESPEIFPCLTEFEVLPFNECLSDA